MAMRRCHLRALEESSCDVLGALGPEIVVADVQTRHRPGGRCGCYVFLGRASVNLLALGKSSCDMFGAFSAKKVRADVEARQRPLRSVNRGQIELKIVPNEGAALSHAL